MRNKLSIFFLLAILSSLLFIGCEDKGEVVTFEDAILENHIRGVIRKPEGQIYQKDVLEIEYLNVYEGRDKVSRLEGIENLLNLKELSKFSIKILKTYYQAF